MARSAQSSRSPKVQKKTFRAQAKQAGVPFHIAKQTQAAQLAAQKVPAPVGIVRRNPGRMDGVQWKGRSFLCPAHVDGSDSSDDTSFEYDSEGPEEDRPSMIIASLLDIARPAKPKGVAKEFEVIQRVKQVIVLEDDDEWEKYEDFEEWENIYEDTSSSERETPLAYSTVVRDYKR